MEQSPSETVAAPSPPKKKRGRPKKADKLLLLQNEASGAATPMKVRRKRKKGLLKSVPVASHGREKGVSPSTSKISDSDGDHTDMTAPGPVAERADVNVGQQVHGVVDGMFDAGYLVTVRVGETESVFRGVVFGPGLSLPLNKENDVAPKLKRMNQLLNDVIAPTLNDQGAAASAPAALPHAPAHSASMSTSSTSTMPAPDGAVTMAMATPPPPSGSAAGYSPATSYRSPLFVQGPLQNASGGLYYAPPPNPNANHGPAYYPPTGFPAYAFQYPPARAASSQVHAAAVSPFPNMQGTLPPRAS